MCLKLYVGISRFKGKIFKDIEIKDYDELLIGYVNQAIKNNIPINIIASG